MPLGVKPVCTSCKGTTSCMWRKNEKDEIICNSCYVKQFSDNRENLDEEMREGSPVPASSGAETNNTARPVASNNGSNSSSSLVRKSSRIRPSGRGRSSHSSKSLTMKGKSRRSIFKKNPIKSPNSVSTVLTSDYVFHEGSYYQVGDVVSLLDHSGEVYYAQIRGFLQDQFLEKSAVITWLIPTQGSEPNRFDPATYILGPEEDLPRKLEFMEFVCHAPSDYYKCNNAPYPTNSTEPDLCFVWTSIGPKIRTTPSRDEIFGPFIEEEREKPSKCSREKHDKRKSEKVDKSVVSLKLEG